MDLGILIPIFGGLGIFIFGMKLLSESLENAAGDNLKNILSKLTGNSFLAVFTGFIITSIIQSSSATTVMVVSFVNAGLMNLTQALGIIMGANIGTTITGWIVNLTNVKVDMTWWAYLGVIIGIIFIFLKNKRKLNNWGYALIGFGLLFIGLDTLKHSIPTPSILPPKIAVTEFNDNIISKLEDENDKSTIFSMYKLNKETQEYVIIDGNPDKKQQKKVSRVFANIDYRDNSLSNFFQKMSNFGYFSIILFVLFGAFVTVVVQSSSVTMALTIMIANQGYIEFPYAAALVLGGNIGTTVTAFLASLAGNRMAKKTAFAHFLFNVVGSTWFILPFVFYPILRLCESTSANFTFFSSGAQAGVNLAIFHSLFNIINTLLLVWFIPQIVTFIEAVLGKPDKTEKTSLLKIEAGLISTPELALYEVQQAINQMATVAHKSFKKTLSLFDKGTDSKDVLNQVKSYEDKINTYENDIYLFLIELLRDDNAGKSADEVHRMMDVIRYFESIGDSCENIAKLIKKSGSFNYKMSDANKEYLTKIRKKLSSFFKLVIDNLNELDENLVLTKSIIAEKDIDTLYKKMKKNTISDMKKIKDKMKKNVSDGLLFLDILRELEYIGDGLEKVVDAYKI